MAACSQTAQTAVDQSVPTRCKSHTPQVETGEQEACRGQFPVTSAILLGPPAVKDQDEGALSKDGNRSNQTTQVVHLGGRLFEALGETKKAFYSPSPFPVAHDELQTSQTVDVDKQSSRLGLKRFMSIDALCICLFR